MADAVRELAVKFKLEADAGPAKRFAASIGGLKDAVAGFAIGKFVAGVSQLEMGFSRTLRSIELMAGEKGVGFLKKQLESLKPLTSSQAEIAEAIRNSIESIGDIKFTGLTLQAATEYAAILEKPAQDIQAAFDQAVSGRSFAPLKSLGLTVFDELFAKEKAGQEFTPEQIKREIVGRLGATQDQRQELLAKAMEDAGVQMERSARILSDVFLQSGKELNEGFLAPMLKGLNDFAEDSQGQFEKDQEELKEKAETGELEVLDLFQPGGGKYIGDFFSQVTSSNLERAKNAPSTRNEGEFTELGEGVRGQIKGIFVDQKVEVNINATGGETAQKIATEVGKAVSENSITSDTLRARKATNRSVQ